MFKILNPCRNKTWDEMPGDDRSRFCDDCGKHVHAIHRYGEAERTALLSRTGRLCIYDTGPAQPPTSRRVLLGASLLGTLRPLWARTATLRLRVTDITGAPVAGAEIQAKRANKALLAQAKTGPQGDGNLAGLPEGDEIEITAQAMGFHVWSKWIRPAVAGDALIEVVLEVGATLGEVISLVEPVPIQNPQPAAPARQPWWRRFGR